MITLKCDWCEDSIDVEGCLTSGEARREAENYDWSQSNNRDFCSKKCLVKYEERYFRKLKSPLPEENIQPKSGQSFKDFLLLLSIRKIGVIISLPEEKHPSEKPMVGTVSEVYKDFISFSPRTEEGEAKSLNFHIPFASINSLATAKADEIYKKEEPFPHNNSVIEEVRDASSSFFGTLPPEATSFKEHTSSFSERLCKIIKSLEEEKGLLPDKILVPPYYTYLFTSQNVEHYNSARNLWDGVSIGESPMGEFYWYSGSPLDFSSREGYIPVYINPLKDRYSYMYLCKKGSIVHTIYLVKEVVE